MAYQTSDKNEALDILDVASLEAEAQQTMDKGAFGYIASGAEDEYTLRANTAAFYAKKIVPRSLGGVAAPDLSTSLFGVPLKSPFIVSPAAAHGLAHVEAERASAQGAGAAGSLFSISTYSTATTGEIAAAAPETPLFAQLYMSKHEEFNRYILGEAVKAGAKAIVFTVDATVSGYREADKANHFQYPVPMGNLVAFAQSGVGGEVIAGQGQGVDQLLAATKQNLDLDDLAWVKELSGLPVLVKGVQSADDAARIVAAGADGIWVSNHGGRQLDCGPASFDVLPRIARAVGGRVPIMFDSGVRRGSHAFKALARGADIIGLGRPIIYGLYLGGARGVTSVLEHLAQELAITMQLAGTQTIADVKKAKLMGKGLPEADVHELLPGPRTY